MYVTEDRGIKSIRITVPNDSPNITYLVTGLTPYTRYAWKVAAVNDAGVGVLTSLYVFKTLEDGEENIMIVVDMLYNTATSLSSNLCTCLRSSWSSVKLVLQHNIKHFSSDYVE